MPNDPIQPRRCAELLAALASPERLRIVRVLSRGSRCVSEIASELEMIPVNLSHHLDILKKAKIVRHQKRGRFVHYRLAPGILEEVIAAGIPKQALDLGCCVLMMPGEAGAVPCPPTCSDSAAESQTQTSQPIAVNSPPSIG
ncbi:ArsR/SmtB family transcription factor [Tuwongella immobilis]|uniref:HTH arsR-type domain-containing protein n=1 Tax=Tuwongella immobilis TaxID=692036 RepID=A0A6C2YPJ4_9BACT|nr:metalloregulator ArsR/SmtB family transcription factor [Tuwongella immobilis]VIP03548.1 family transcriptional regulator : Transcriptional regulator, ArsR family OS=Pirellula staleyi (strain ATCC 27377 / DSM 6068 / ICPB 4128) GN=Psta_1414 PE=4 SV=1: HTH_5 [Tuwongella immobilis]VTS04464.1 family transcriptional regulator : Transcriptional regulator, ArsR family OS=Pirellula staleyi (strain ATCC 27377 / DSM 6068 / ICPB 4128) GN=Psta_1414 PE=4 SV=1: HTH_5 [Tuwongella immobilis]